MPGDGKGLELQLRIRRLMKKHRLEPSAWDLCHVPMVASMQHPQILEGYASTTHLDRSRMRFRGWAFPLPRNVTTIPLYYKHRENQVVGQITELDYDAEGQLRIRCTVDHPEARRCSAFSVGATVHEYEIINAERPDFYGLIKQATLDEISCTDVPANPRALVTGRYPVSAQVQFLDHALTAMHLIQQSLAVLQQMQRGVRP